MSDWRDSQLQVSWKVHVCISILQNVDQLFSNFAVRGHFSSLKCINMNKNNYSLGLGLKKRRVYNYVLNISGVNPQDMPRTLYRASEGKHSIIHHALSTTLTSSSVHHSFEQQISFYVLQSHWKDNYITAVKWRKTLVYYYLIILYRFFPCFQLESQIK